MAGETQARPKRRWVIKLLVGLAVFAFVMMGLSFWTLSRWTEIETVPAEDRAVPRYSGVGVHAVRCLAREHLQVGLRSFQPVIEVLVVGGDPAVHRAQ